MRENIKKYLKYLVLTKLLEIFLLSLIMMIDYFIINPPEFHAPTMDEYIQNVIIIIFYGFVFLYPVLSGILFVQLSKVLKKRVLILVSTLGNFLIAYVTLYVFGRMIFVDFYGYLELKLVLVFIFMLLFTPTIYDKIYTVSAREHP